MEHNHSIPNPKLPDYDLHMPGFLTYPLPVSIISIMVGCLLYFLLQKHSLMAGFLVGICILSGGLYVGLSVLIKRFTNLERRLKARDRLLCEILWQGNEIVLDVGCGNGILILEAAKRLKSGKGIGIEIWTDSSGDSRQEAFQENAKIEGVADRVSLQNEDVRQLPYDNESFDIILCGLTMHHISHGSDTNKAMSEMTRVLKPGGRIAIYDVPIAVYSSAKLMRKNGLEVEKKDRDMVFGIKLPPITSE
jgi:arsenite methyltransferase